jgi:hypothetical protein
VLEHLNAEMSAAQQLSSIGARQRSCPSSWMGSNEGGNDVPMIATSTNCVTGSPIPVGTSPMAFGLFIQPKAIFAGTPGSPNCHGKSVSALAKKYKGIAAAAHALGASSVSALQEGIRAFCNG